MMNSSQVKTCSCIAIALAVSGFAMLVPVRAAQSSLSKSASETISFGDDEVPICNEAPPPADPKERAWRTEKGRRYNLGLSDLRESRVDADGTEHFTFGEQIWPATPAVPTDESALIAVVVVESTQTYFSDDGSNVYTE
jgi:hypothetical protein